MTASPRVRFAPSSCGVVLGLSVSLLAGAATTAIPRSPESAAAASAVAAMAGESGSQSRAERDAARERDKAARAFDRAFARAIRVELAAITDGVAAGGSVAEAEVAVTAALDRVLAWGDPEDVELLRDAVLARRLLALAAAVPEGDQAQAAAFLVQVPNVARRLAFTVRPDVDDLGGVMRTLAALAVVGGERLDAYPDLVAAICVVHDRPVSRRINESVVRGLDPVRVLEHFVGNERELVMPVRRMPAELLLHVVDITTSWTDLDWALQRYRRDADVGDRFSEIDYDTEHLRSGRPKRVTQLGLTLPNIKQHGGVCADQAYFAGGVGKALGIPSCYVRGRSGANAHAWVGFVRDDRQGTRWDFDAGRYEEYQFVRGEIIDPQSGEAVPDSHVSTLVPTGTAEPEVREVVVALAEAARRLETVGRDGAAAWPPAVMPEENAGDAADAADTPAEVDAPAPRRADRRRPRSRGRDAGPVRVPDPVRDPLRPGTAAALDRLRAAVDLLPAHLEPWRVVQGFAAEGRLDLGAKRAWAEAAWRLCGPVWVDLYVDIVGPMIDSVEDPGQRTALWDAVHDRVDGRPDLGAEIRFSQGRIWEEAGEHERALHCYQLLVQQYAGNGPPVQQAVVAAAMLLESNGRGDLVLPFLEDTWGRLPRPSGPRAIQFARGDDWVIVGRFYATALRASRRGGDARRIEQQIESVLR